jgi:hypothetical protein
MVMQQAINSMMMMLMLTCERMLNVKMTVTMLMLDDQNILKDFRLDLEIDMELFVSLLLCLTVTNVECRSCLGSLTANAINKACAQYSQHQTSS